MRVIAFQAAQDQGDTVEFVFQGDNAAASFPIWGASCILEKRGGADSIAHFAFTSNTLASMEIPSWHSLLKDALLIITNGDITASHNASIAIQTCPITYPVGSRRTFTAATPTDTATLSLNALTNLRCPLSVSVVKNDSLLSLAANNRLFPATSLFDISYPASWSTGAAITLAVNSQADVSIGRLSLALYAWSGVAWSKITDSISFVNQSLRVKTSIAQPGIYAVLYSASTAAEAIMVYPNPVHLRTNSSVNIAGKNLLEIRVYTVNGVLISHAQSGARESSSLPSSSTGFNWLLTNSSGIPVVPGMYYFSMSYRDIATQEVKKKNQKVLVIQ